MKSVTTSDKINLLNFSRPQLVAWCAEVLGERPFRAIQLIKWIHEHGVTDFNQMTDLKKTVREKLIQIAEIRLPEIITEQVSKDGTTKWLLRLDGGNSIETVYIPEKERGTLCVSSQVGCALNCSFCSTGKQGFNRNLNTAEIIAQVWIATRRLAELGVVRDKPVTNVVMMGMGEPLLNFDPVIAAMDLMMDDYAYNLSKHKVTLSTSGLIPAMLKLKETSPVCLAVSLHAPNDALRDILVPVNKKYPLAELIPVCKDFFANEPRRSVTFEYVLLDGVNDSLEHARELIKLLEGVPSKVNLIPFNPFPGTQYRRSKPHVIDAFQKKLMDAGLNTIVRRTRGDDIDAACGQLVGKVADRTRRSTKWAIEVSNQLEEL